MGKMYWAAICVLPYGSCNWLFETWFIHLSNFLAIGYRL